MKNKNQLIFLQILIVVVVILALLLVYSWTRTNENCTNTPVSTSYDPADPLVWPFYNYPDAQKEAYIHLRKNGYEVQEIQDIYDGVVSAIMFDADGSDYLQMQEGFWALYLNYDKSIRETYKVQIIKEDKTCFYEVLAEVFTDYIMNENTTVSLYDSFDEGYCID